MASRGFTDQRNPSGIDLIFFGVRFDPADGRFHILRTGRPAMLGGKPITDGEPGEAGFGKWGEQRLDIRLLVSTHETTTVHQNAGWKWSLPFRYKGIERQAD